MDRDYLALPKWFQTFYYNQILRELSGFECMLELSPPMLDDTDLDEHGPEAADSFLRSLERQLETTLGTFRRHHPKTMAHLSRLAFQVAMSSFLERGTRFNESIAFHWLQVSAMSGYPSAIGNLPLCESCLAEGSERGLGNVLLAVGALIKENSVQGDHHSLVILKDKYPRTYQQTLNALQTKQPPEGRLFPATLYGLNIIGLYINAEAIRMESMDIHLALRTRNPSLARRLLDEGDDATTTNRLGFGVMHCLICLEDAIASSLVQVCFDRKAKLDLKSAETDDDIGGSPVFRATRRGLTRLSLAFLRLHDKYDVPIVDDELTVCVAASSHNGPLLCALWLVAERKPYILPFITSLRSGNQAGFSKIITAASQDVGYLIQERRAMHKKAHVTAGLVTLALILRLRAMFAKPVDPDDDTAILTSIKYDWYRVLELSLSSMPLTPHNMVKVLHLSFFRSARRCFAAAIRYFSVIEGFQAYLNEELRGWTILQAVAGDKDPSYTALVVEHVPDVSVERTEPRTGLKWSALSCALVKGMTENAEAIYCHLSATQRETMWEKEREGRTTLGRVLQAWLFNRDAMLINSVKWLHSKGAAFFHIDLSEAGGGEPAWNHILHNPAPSGQSDRLRDKAMMRVLFDIFPDRINSVIDNGEGFAPIHTAVLFGHLEVLELLVEKNVNVNIEASESSTFAGKTAFDLCSGRQYSPPPKILKGGRVSLDIWKQRISTILEYLVSVGGENGNGASAAHLASHLAVSTSLAYHIPDGSSTDPEPEEYVDWPASLPIDNTSPSLDHSMIWVRRPDGQTVAVERAGMEKLIDREMWSSYLGPTNRFKAWLQRQATQYYKLWRESDPLWPIQGLKSEDATLHLNAAIIDRACGYYYPEIDMCFGVIQNMDFELIVDLDPIVDRAPLYQMVQGLLTLGYVPERLVHGSTKWSFAGPCRSRWYGAEHYNERHHHRTSHDSEVSLYDTGNAC